MNLDTMFPDAFSEGVDERVTAQWDLSGPLPIPRFPRYCPRCCIGTVYLYSDDETLVVKDWRFHERRTSGSPEPWRCDVRMKCVRCSLVLSFGVKVPKPMHAAAPHKNWIGYREGKALLKQAGYFERE